MVVFIEKIKKRRNAVRRISSKARTSSLSFSIKTSESFGVPKVSLLSALKDFAKNWRCWCNLASIEDCGFHPKQLDGTASFACLFPSRNLLIRVQIPDTALYEVKGGSKTAFLLPPFLLFFGKIYIKRILR